MRESNNDSSYMGSVSIDNAPVLNEKQTDEPSIENINDNKKSKGSVSKDGMIGKKGNTELSEDCFIGADAAPSELLKDIVNINASNILDPLLAVRKSCFKKMTVENNLRWQKKEISFPLLRMENEDDEEGSKQMFRNLLSYMGDRKSSKMPLLHARKYVKLVLIGNNILRDEAYIQVYKQLHNNPNHESNMRGWKMMAIISSVFVPKNKDIYNLILNFLFFEMQNKKDPQLLNHIRYIFVRMIRMKMKERHHVPCEEELGCIERLVPIELPVKFFTGNQTNVKIESYTTIRDLFTKFAKKNLVLKKDSSMTEKKFATFYPFGTVKWKKIKKPEMKVNSISISDFLYIILSKKMTLILYL